MDEPEPQFNSLAERIAALNKQNNFNNGTGTGTSTGVKQPSQSRRNPPPPPPSGGPRSNISSNPAKPLAAAGPPPLPRRDTQSSVPSQSSEKPALPPRTPSINQLSPPLPSRRPSSSIVPGGYFPSQRRNSASSEISQLSTVSTTSLSLRPVLSNTSSHDTRKVVAPAFDPSSLPPLPPTRREKEAQAAAAPRRPTPVRAPASSASSIGQISPAPPVKQIEAAPTIIKAKSPPALPSRPAAKKPASSLAAGDGPKVPDRPVNKAVSLSSNGAAAAAAATTPKTSPQPYKVKGFSTNTTTPSSKIMGFGTRMHSSEGVPMIPDGRPTEDALPMIPKSSRPSQTQINSLASWAATPAPREYFRDECWVCRDWSGPDTRATQFPRSSLPRQDPIGYLARGLCDPFPSYTEKARAIFTWFHHNILYDVVTFFERSLKPTTPEETILSGKAVCQGYAETYKAIANRAGLECEVVGGHGKGYGHTPLKKGERPPPPGVDGHAWNAVRVDGGFWKLIDSCWGAGHLDTNTNQYKQLFSPGEFTKSNVRFGATHFPTDPRFQYREDGRYITWEEYFIGRVDGEPPVLYSNVKEEGIVEDSIEPKERQIPVYSGGVVRFQFSKLCEHWTSEKHGLGKTPLLLLHIHGEDGRKDEMVPIETNGFWHWIDVNARELGKPGQSVQVAILTELDGRDGRGVTAEEYMEKKDRGRLGWGYVMLWDLV